MFVIAGFTVVAYNHRAPNLICSDNLEQCSHITIRGRVKIDVVKFEGATTTSTGFTIIMAKRSPCLAGPALPVREAWRCLTSRPDSLTLRSHLQE